MPAKPGRKRAPERSRTDLLEEISRLPPDAFIPTLLAAAYIDTTPSVMGSWRSQRRGPRYYGSREFIRYKIEDLDRWMATRSEEVPKFENLEKLARASTAA